MATCFHLIPTDLKHGSWQYSITKKAVFILANDETEARRLVAGTLVTSGLVAEDNTKRFPKLVMPVTPWDLPEATSCIVAPDACSFANYIVAEDGEKWQIADRR
jgi:hypothetical protein